MLRIYNTQDSDTQSAIGEKEMKGIPLGHNGITFTIHLNISEIENQWNKATLHEHFASSPYLKTLEHDSSDNLTNIYILIKNAKNSIVGTILAQRLILSLGDSFRYENYSKDQSFVSHWWQKIRQFIVNRFQFRMLTIGNLYLTGHYGYHFIDPAIEKTEQIKIVELVVKSLRKEFKCGDLRFSGVLFKDYFVEDRIPNKLINDLITFQIDPNMILDIDGAWQNFDDYLASMRSKYRIRLKNALRKFHPLQRRKLNLADISVLRESMYQLYKKILDGSGFVLAKGEKDYFYTLKKELGDQLHVIGYFKDEQLVGFYTWVIDGKKLDSHFIGVEPSLNLRHQIYLNILLDLVRDAIEYRAERLFYYRTALEIKSSIGARPHDMWCYFKHNNSLLNKYFIPTAFKYFVPKPQWVQRHPFKSKATLL